MSNYILEYKQLLVFVLKNKMYLSKTTLWFRKIPDYWHAVYYFLTQFKWNFWDTEIWISFLIKILSNVNGWDTQTNVVFWVTICS